MNEKTWEGQMNDWKILTFIYFSKIMLYVQEIIIVCALNCFCHFISIVMALISFK